MAAVPARAAFYCAAADFSATNNPTGVWSYSWTPTNVVHLVTGRFQPGQLSSHPGPSNEISVVRFTTPTAGGYDLHAAFVGIDTVGPATDVRLLMNGAPIPDGLVNGFGPATRTAFNTTLTLAAGDTVDFPVGERRVGHGHDSGQ